MCGKLAKNSWRLNSQKQLFLTYTQFGAPETLIYSSTEYTDLATFVLR